MTVVIEIVTIWRTMVQASMSQRWQLLQVLPGVEPRHQHIPETITTTNATDAKTKLMLLLVSKDLKL